MYKLICFLRTHDDATHLMVRLSKCTVSASGFYQKMGFEKMTKTDARAGDALFLDTSKNIWKEMSLERVGGVLEVLAETSQLQVEVQEQLLQSLWTPLEERPKAAEKPVSAINTHSNEIEKWGEGAMHLGK